jgi:transposase-like protein
MVDNYIIDVVGTLQYILEAVDDEGDAILFYLENKTYSVGVPSLTEEGL